uniref:DUF2569 domain-containing protein n=1 Tax=uncultured Erythrobacter sp. TaxID=263913 RepID=UPI0026207BDD|nr:DUF2569 domain-containing protein [uncultured Erythrobacter sp.]
MTSHSSNLFDSYARRAAMASRDAIRGVCRNLTPIALAWLGVVALVAIVRVIASPTPATSLAQLASLAVPYVLVGLAPIAGFIVGRNAFLGKARHRSASVQLSRIGAWQEMSPREARRHPSFGPVGFMASLIIGMLINVALRTAEFAMAIPALTTDAPAWGYTLFWLATLDTVMMNFFYAVCFVMALRTVPLFPKMLLFAWLVDIAMQLTIAQAVSSYPLPGEVAIALEQLLSGNIDKVLISMMIWLPYLILADRVNVTYRHRAPAVVAAR